MVEDSRAPSGARALRPLNEPVPAAVEATERGIPKGVLWRGTYRLVVAIRDTWRIDDEWWREELARRYFVVEVEGGRQITLFHDLVRDLWYIQPYELPGAGNGRGGAGSAPGKTLSDSTRLRAG